jgi:type IV secretory pathway VirB10-like protein
MTTNTGAFFVGVGTTVAILAMGFGSGLIMAKTAVEPRAEQQARAPRESSPAVRVILPASAEPAQPPQPSTTTIAAPTPPAPLIAEASVSEKMPEKADTRKADVDERERKRYAERKTRRLAERAKHRQQMEQGQYRNPPVMAFGADESRQGAGSGFFGN